MDAKLGTDLDGCPLLAPTRSIGRGETAVGIYCRLPDGRVRVPAPDEIKRYCARQAFDECPVYRRHASAR